jgi:hypothetical protein
MANTNSMTDQERLRMALDRLIRLERPRYRRLWAYFKNPMRVCGVQTHRNNGAHRPYRQAQEWGLPTRITGLCSGDEPFINTDQGEVARKEVVIENDIGWRVDTLVDYLFGKPLVISSLAPDPARRELIGRVLGTIFEQNGGIQFLQRIALLGSVYGFVDVLVKSSPGGNRTPETQVEAGPALAAQPRHAEGVRGGAAADGDGERISGADIGDDALLQRVAQMIRFEIVEPARALPLLSCEDYRIVQAYGQVWEREEGSGFGVQGSEIKSTWWDRLRSFLSPSELLRRGNATMHVVELIMPDHWLRLEDGKVIAQGGNSLGEVPLVHIQNTAAAFEYAGASDVEPLIPLQDELNTRLSDRAHRISLQSFKMYLAKGIDSFNDQPVSPGRMWLTDNEQASIQEFGGDASCPSEESHISDVREALDKTSGVTPIAAGAIKNRIGRLTSAAALRVTLLALLSKTDKKRTSYGAGIERMCALALKWLDVAGVFATTPDERRIELSWPSPLPENEIEKLQEAEVKLRLGVEKAVVLRELGY